MATLKELLTAMVDKINRKIASPAEEPHANMQLVTDADGVAKWEEKPFYAEVTAETIVEPITGTMGIFSDFTYFPEIEAAELGELDEGTVIRVVFDGVTYDCPLKVDYSHPNFTPKGYGNFKWITGDPEDDTGEPFLIHNDPEGYGEAYGDPRFVATVSGGTHAIAIYGMPTETVKTIDPKYLPEGVGYVIPATDAPIFENVVFESTETVVIQVDDQGEKYVIPPEFFDKYGGENLFYDYWQSVERFVVVWDGVEYRDLEAAVYTSSGNRGPFSWGCPFTLFYKEGNLWIGATEIGTHTFSIYEQGEPKVVTIPEEFIPSMSALVLRSPSGKLFKLSVSDDGEPAFAEVTD